MTISGELLVCILLTILNGFLVSLGLVLAKSIYLTKYPVRMYCSEGDSFLSIACLLSNSRMISRT